jgi:hypothetical protein
MFEKTYGGIVEHSMPGHPNDAGAIMLSWAAMRVTASATQLFTEPATVTLGGSLLKDDAIAARFDASSDAFVSAVEMTLKRTGTLANAGEYVSVEVWEGSATLPTVKVGTLGVLENADLGVGAYAQVTRWADRAFPITTDKGYIVLNAAGCTGAGSFDWASDNPPTAAGHAAYNDATGLWTTANGILCCTIWEGSQFLRICGLQEAKNYPGGAAPVEYEFEAEEDSRLLTVHVAGIKGGWFLPLTARDTIGFADRVTVLLPVTSVIGERALVDNS